MSYNDVPRFEFAAQVIQEALRLYPPFWMIDRMAVADDHAGDVAIPRGSTVIVFVYGAHHAPKYWQNPERFDPERFTKANEKLQPPFTYLPFGGGPRGCIGGNYAMLQILMILSVLPEKIRFSTGSRPDDRSAPDGHFAAETRNSHELYRGNRARPSRSPSEIEKIASEVECSRRELLCAES